jgi:prepilin-type N-terminal cleavage/methylation domain-containing protein
MKSSKGFSLLEMLLVMSIISVLLIGVARYYETASSAQKENEAVTLVQGLKAAGERYRIGKTVSSANILQELIDRNLIPVSAKTNPWGGQVTVAMASSGKITITLAAIPGGACQSLAGIFNPDPANKTPETTLCSGDVKKDPVVSFTYSF